MVSASTLKPSSLVISNRKCGWSLFVGHPSSSDGGGSSSEAEAAPNKTQSVELLFHIVLKQFNTLKGRRSEKVPFINQ